MNGVELKSIFDLIKNKDNYGIELLYKDHYRFIIGTAFSITKNEDNAKDVLQNVFYKLFTMSKDKFPNKGEMTWLYTVIKNEALMYIRKEKNVLELKDNIEVPCIDKNIADFIEMDHYNSLIKNLDDKQREVVTLKIIGGLSHKEIAETLNKPIGTIQWIHNTSIKKLKTIYLAMLSFILFIIGTISYRVYNINNLNVNPFPESELESIPENLEQLPLFEVIVNDKVIICLTLSFIIVFILFVVMWKHSGKISINKLCKIERN